MPSAGLALTRGAFCPLNSYPCQAATGQYGMHSRVREQAAIPFIGGDCEESLVLADVEMDWPLDREEVSLFFSGKGLVVVAPLSGNHFRIVATMSRLRRHLRSQIFSRFLRSADQRRLPSQFDTSFGPLGIILSIALPRFHGKAESCWLAMPRTFIVLPAAKV